MTEVVYRRSRDEDDFASTYAVFLSAANDLRARSHRPPLADTVARRTPAIAFRQHAHSHDRHGYWIAETGGRIIGFGIATARPGFWHLNALHVLPE